MQQDSHEANMVRRILTDAHVLPVDATGERTLVISTHDDTDEVATLALTPEGNAGILELLHRAIMQLVRQIN